jgi:hypothetical protein
MSDYDAQEQLERVIEEVRVLTRPQVIGDLIQDAAGLFLPGFSALPAVTILSNRSWKTRIKPQAERWRTGDIVALKATSGTHADAKQQTVFFTPVGDCVIPLIDVTPGKDVARFEKSVQLKPKDRWETVELQFAFLPWDAERESKTWSSKDLLAISRVLDWAGREMSVWLDLEGQRVPMEPLWGLSPWVAKTSLDSIRFPINHATKIISPFIFRLQIQPEQVLPGGRVVELTKETLTVNFEFPEEALRTVYREAGLGQPELSGISVFGNGLPVMNLDLKAWLLNDSFEEFVRTAGMKPLGVAGIYPYLKAGQVPKQDLEPVTSHANVFSLEIDSSGRVLSRYDLPGEENTMDKKQLLLWMTHGALINGINYKYGGTDIIQPLQKPSLLLNQTATILPCFGGYDCGEARGGDWYDKLMMNYATPPQTLLYRDSLIHTIEDIVAKLGYERVTIQQPVTELRVIGGNRRRVTVVYLENRGGRPFDSQHLAMIQSFVDDRSPLGSHFIVEPA